MNKKPQTRELSPDETAISITGVSKYFAPTRGQGSIKQAVTSLVSAKTRAEKNNGFWALKDVSFQIKKGEFFGIVGRNGSGKSTLLKMIAGVYTPTKGSISVNGTLVPFIELGVGFNPELSGKDNVFLNGALLGFNRRDMEDMYDEIVRFAELEEHMDVKLKNFSSGMQVRLAFSIAIQAKTDILLIDEVLAVGDALFQKKCFDYFKRLKTTNQTVILVSHDTSILRQYCTKGALIEGGALVSTGDITDITNSYIDILTQSKGESSPRNDRNIDKQRWGDGSVIIKNISLTTNTQKQALKKSITLGDHDSEVRLVVDYYAKKTIPSPIYGITVTDDSSGLPIFVTNTLWEELSTKPLAEGQKISVEYRFPNFFSTGKYIVSPAVASDEGLTMHDWVENGICIDVVRAKRTGYLSIDHTIRLR